MSAPEAKPGGFVAPSNLVEILEEAQAFGFLGPGPVEAHIRHALGLARFAGRGPGAFVDLGSGGGVPGLVLALLWPASTGVLLEAMARRAEHLERACRALGFGGRVRVLGERAETAARRPELRGSVDLVCARSFGPPATTAECAVGFMRPGGVLVVSEPPTDSPGRWPGDGLGLLGLRVEKEPTVAERFVLLRCEVGADPRWPRRTGVPRKRPLWGEGSRRST